jgi:HTH-type transcriptional repressor of NAD biosynthesis genes
VNVIPVADIFTDDTTKESSVYWAIYTNDIMEGVEFDAVFGSEPYIENWARQLAVEPVFIDTRRTLVPISGTAIRENPSANWSYIAPEFRRFYLRRVLIVGAESTGKTTLAKNLAEHYATRFVPEWGRVFIEQNVDVHQEVPQEYKRVTFGSILNNQPRLEDEIEQQAHRVCFYDTDLFTTSLWYAQWQNEGDDLMKLIMEKVAEREPRYDVVFLMSDESADWVNDGYREQTRGVRSHFTGKLRGHFSVAERHEHGPRLFELNGSWDSRQLQAVNVVDSLLAGRFNASTKHSQERLYG